MTGASALVLIPPPSCAPTGTESGGGWVPPTGAQPASVPYFVMAAGGGRDGFLHGKADPGMDPAMFGEVAQRHVP